MKVKISRTLRASKILFSHSLSLSPKKEKKNRHAETKERDFCHEIDFWTPGAREGKGFYTF